MCAVLLSDQFVRIQTEYGSFAFYVGGTDEEGTDEWRLTFVSAIGEGSIDMPPTEVAKLARLIRETLDENGLDEDGIPYGESPEMQLCDTQIMCSK